MKRTIVGLVKIYEQHDPISKSFNYFRFIISEVGEIDKYIIYRVKKLDNYS